MGRYAEYKDSGSIWAGDIPSNWDSIRLQFLCDISTGNKDTVDRDDSGKFPFYVRSPIIEHINSYSFDGEAVLMAGDGAGAGRIFHYANGKFDYHQRVYNLHNFRRVSGKYLYYFLQENFHKEIDRSNARSTVDSVRLPMLQDFVITFPNNIDEQAYIVEYLDDSTKKIDESVANLQSQSSMLTCYKRDLIAECVTKGLDKSAPMKPSGEDWIGDVPTHWQIVPLRAFLKPNNRKNPGGFPLLSVERERGVVNREMDGLPDNHNRVPDDLSNYKMVDEGQFVMNKMKAWQGSYGVAPCAGIVSPAYYVYDLVVENKAFFNYALRSKCYVGFFGRDSYGIRIDQWDFKAECIKHIPFVAPPIEEQKEIVNYLSKQESKINRLQANIEAQIQKLKDYRRILIHDAVTGKIKI